MSRKIGQFIFRRIAWMVKKNRWWGKIFAAPWAELENQSSEVSR